MRKTHSAIKIFKRPVRMVQQMFRIVRFCRRTTPLCSAKYPGVFLRAVRLCRKEGFAPKEAFPLGLFDPKLSSSELSKYTSRKRMTEIQQSINPTSWDPIVRNKGIFYRYCMALDVPVPKLYAIFFAETAGWSYNGSVLITPDDWKTFFDRKLPSEFVVKPSEGSYGRAINFFRRTKKGFIDAAGKSYDSKRIYDEMFLHPEYNSFVIQERLRNHSELVRLSGTESLQTVRIVTFVAGDMGCHILHGFFKPITGDNVVDNFDRGLTGNLQVEVSLNDGMLKSAVKIAPGESGIKTVHKHPKTGISFDQFRLPLWHQACSLVKKTALKFLPVRTIGWDVALTPKGVFILEGNNWWSPLNVHRCMDIVLDKIFYNSQST